MHEMNHNPQNYEPRLLKFPLEIGEDADSKMKARIPMHYFEAQFPPIAENGTLRNSQPENDRKRRSSTVPTKTAKELENNIYLTVKEAAIYTNTPENTIRSKWVTMRKAPYHKIGKSLLFKRVELDEWMDQQKIEPITID